MALSTMCRLGLTFATAVSAVQGDWEGSARHYAGNFYHGPADGEFTGYLQQGKEHSVGLREYASQHSQDRISEAREDANAFTQVKRLDQAQEAVQHFSKQGEGLVGGLEKQAAAFHRAAAHFSKQGEGRARDLEKQAAGFDGAAGHFLKRGESQAQGFEKQVAGFDPDVGAATALAAVPAAVEPNQEVTPAKDSEQPVDSAEAGLQKLGKWDEELKADLQDKNFSVEVAKSIVSKVQASNVLQRAELESKFDSALRAMSEATNGSEVRAAEQAARGHAKELSRLNEQERKAMHKTLRSIEKQGKRKARALWKQVREAAHGAYHLGMDAARAQRRAGVEEHIYERAIGDAQEVSEGLSDKAEHLAEHAEDLVERQTEAVEHALEKMMDHLQDASQEAHCERLHRAVQDAKQAKHTLEAQDRSGADNHEDHSSDSGETKADLKEATKKGKQNGGHPSAFLALDEPASMDRVVALCALALVPMSSFLVLRCRREDVRREIPLLG